MYGSGYCEIPTLFRLILFRATEKEQITAKQANYSSVKNFIVLIDDCMIYIA